ncbi:hypothetical protein AAHZ94_24355 [Streptomyces sp. HSW2009]|uniref:hypothetical protein n=1 Tax=Streptomyces sp. HSW2009 TaxID=3142890 RepID=UPI0032EEFAD8
MTPLKTPWHLVPGPLRRTVRAEWGPLAAAVRAGLARRRAAALVVTIAAVSLIVICQYIQNQPWGHDVIAFAGYVQADQPWWGALLRTPLSLFVPAPDLPVWGGLLQIFVVFGICECALGWRRTLVIAYAATMAGTAYARLGLALGPDALLGLPADIGSQHDTGPSAAVVGLSVYVCWRYRAWLTGALVIGSMVLEVYAKPNLAGREHLVAILAILVVCAVSTRVERLHRLARRTAPRPTAGERAWAVVRSSRAGRGAGPRAAGRGPGRPGASDQPGESAASGASGASGSRRPALRLVRGSREFPGVRAPRRTGPHAVPAQRTASGADPDHGARQVQPVQAAETVQVAETVQAVQPVQPVSHGREVQQARAAQRVRAPREAQEVGKPPSQSWNLRRSPSHRAS